MNNPVYLIKSVETHVDTSGDYNHEEERETVIGYFSGSKEELYKLIEKEEEKIEEANKKYLEWTINRKMYFYDFKATQKNLEKSVKDARQERRDLFASLLELSKQDGKDDERKKTSEALDTNDKLLTILSFDLSKMEKMTHESRLRIFLETNPEPKEYPSPTRIDFEELKEFKGL